MGLGAAYEESAAKDKVRYEQEKMQYDDDQWKLKQSPLLPAGPGGALPPMLPSA